MNPPHTGTFSTSFKVRTDAFNGDIDTTAINSRIAEHVGWTGGTASADDPSASGTNTLPAAMSPRSVTAPSAAVAAVALRSAKPEAAKSCGGAGMGVPGAAGVGPLCVVNSSKGGVA